MSYNYSSRTASQSSIYDYPEHLNPFYEDENHKRLRFWQLGRSTSRERRGSLASIRDNIRDMWEFKTFRLKKKRASSLGINQTSESPPPLRRENPESHYNTVSSTSSAYRNTVGPGYTQSNTTTPLFQRNSRYRGSLQDQTKENGIGFSRNDRYRSTIQNGFATYSGGSMVTSTPRSNHNPTQNGRGMTAGVSQSSLKSSNPFEDDDLNDCVSLNDSSLSAGNGTVRSSIRSHKKRRAPPPPPVRKASSSINGPSEEALLSTRLKIEESPPPENPEDVQKLTNLTAEIESFVRATSDESPSKIQNVEEETTPSNDTNNNEIITTELVIVENISQTEKPPEQPEPPSTEIIKQDLNTHPTNIITIPEPVESLSLVQELQIAEEPKTIPPLPSPRARPAPPPVPQTPPTVVDDVDFENLSLPETPIPARRNNRNRTLSKQSNANTALRITEDNDTPLPTPDIASSQPRALEEEENMAAKAVKPVSYEFQYKVEPIKTEIDEKIGTARLRISESTGDINALPGAGDQRRSVRDIIESINKSQSLLKVNYETPTGLQSSQSNDSVNRNMRELNEREKEIQSLLREMDARFGDHNQAAAASDDVSIPPKKRGSYYDNVPDGDENMDNLMNKSGLRSKKSPTKSLGIDNNGDEVGQFQDCHDWNPLPKPRRSRNLGDFPNGANQSTTGTVLTAIDQNNNTNHDSK